jgi:hypothetical protein
LINGIRIGINTIKPSNNSMFCSELMGETNNHLTTQDTRGSFSKSGKGTFIVDKVHPEVVFDQVAPIPEDEQWPNGLHLENVLGLGQGTTSQPHLSQIARHTNVPSQSFRSWTPESDANSSHSPLAVGVTDGKREALRVYRYFAGSYSREVLDPKPTRSLDLWIKVAPTGLMLSATKGSQHCSAKSPKGHGACPLHSAIQFPCEGRLETSR